MDLDLRSCPTSALRIKADEYRKRARVFSDMIQNRKHYSEDALSRQYKRYLELAKKFGYADYYRERAEILAQQLKDRRHYSDEELLKYFRHYTALAEACEAALHAQ